MFLFYLFFSIPNDASQCIPLKRINVLVCVWMTWPVNKFSPFLSIECFWFYLLIQRTFEFISLVRYTKFYCFMVQVLSDWLQNVVFIHHYHLIYRRTMARARQCARVFRFCFDNVDSSTTFLNWKNGQKARPEINGHRLRRCRHTLHWTDRAPHFINIFFPLLNIALFSSFP